MPADATSGKEWPYSLDLPELLTVPETCQLLRLEKSSIYAMVHSQKLRAFGVGTKDAAIRVVRDSVFEYIRRSMIGGELAAPNEPKPPGAKQKFRHVKPGKKRAKAGAK